MCQTGAQFGNSPPVPQSFENQHFRLYACVLWGAGMSDNLLIVREIVATIATRICYLQIIIKIAENH